MRRLGLNRLNKCSSDLPVAGVVGVYEIATDPGVRVVGGCIYNVDGGIARGDLNNEAV